MTRLPGVAGDLDGFRRDGYAVLPGLLTGQALVSARRAASAAVDSRSETSCERPNNTLVPLRWDHTLVQLGTAAAARIVAAIDARDLRWISGYVSVKDPASPPLWWHQDWWAWDHPISLGLDAPQIALLCYLSDTSVTSGALRVIPGSHRASVALHAELPSAHSDDATALDLDHPAMADNPDQVSLELKAGDAVVTDYRLLHGTHANRSQNQRDCLLLTFTPNWSSLPPDVRGHLIQHPALPDPTEEVRDCGIVDLLPSFDGARIDLVLNRNAPASFATSGAR